jgi:hypothetical protein
MRASAAILLAMPGLLFGQWLQYPTAGVPSTPSGLPNLGAPAPKTADGKPDFSGIWEADNTSPCPPEGCPDMPSSREFVNIGARLPGGLPYQPWAAELVKKRQTEDRVNDQMSRCAPIGPIRLHTWNGPRKVAQTPGLLIVMNELDSSYRQIYTDGRPLPVDPNPSWNGYSSGKWEGDSLVVHSAGFRDRIWLDATGNPMTDAAKITERFHRIDFGHMDIEITVDDPKAYTKAWSVMLHQVISLDTDLLDFVCGDNEKDVPHLSSK